MHSFIRTSLVAQRQRIHLPMQEPQEIGFNPWVGKIPWQRKWQCTPVFLPENPTARGAWMSTVHGVAALDRTE